MNKTKKFEASCTGLNEFGQGIINLSKKEYAVSNLLPKETAIIEINEDFKYPNPRVLKLIKESIDRKASSCPIYDKCGGCQLLHMKYDYQLDFKKDYVLECYKKYKIKFKIYDVISANKQSEYRNKMQVAYKYQNNKLVFGFYEESSHRVIPLKECLVQTKIQVDICKYIEDLMVSLRIKAYDEDKRTGLIRFVLIKEGFTTKDLMVVIVTNEDKFPGRNEFIKRLTTKFKEITTIVQNINKRKTSIILGDDENVLFGKGYIEDYLCGYKFQITSKSFFQINPEQTEKLYTKAIEMAGFKKSDVVIDAYSGVGTIGISFAKHVSEVISVENNKQAHLAAIRNSKINGINNVKFVNDDATLFIERILKEKVKIDVVIMDPPRSGSTEKFLNALLKLKPRKIVYVSCEASTQARDIAILVKDYEIKDTAIVDLFVGTYHIESVVLLELKK